MTSDPKSNSTAPSTEERHVPPGASWDAKNARIDTPPTGKVISDDLGPEHPQTAASRPNTVTDEKLPNESVIDDS